MTGQFIKEINIDWNRIDRNSYLRGIPALQFEAPITFDGNITFFAGENGTGRIPSWGTNKTILRKIW